jgi:ribonuclease HII
VIINSDKNYQLLVCGVDEVGRGPLAGPVVAAAVILDPQRPIEGLADSKQLTVKKRSQLSLEIRERSLAWSIARAEVEEIDELNILHATMLAMRRAVDALALQPHRVLVDGNRLPDLSCDAEAVIRGDAIHPCISAASIIAKVARDGEMVEMEMKYPGYGFDRHKGYPTKMHLQALQQLGVTLIHRRSFAPVKKLL